MKLHRQPAMRALPRVQALLVKYRLQLSEEVGEKAATRAYHSLEAKQTELRAAFAESNRRDEAQRKFDCIRDPGTLANIPDEVALSLSKMEGE